MSADALRAIISDKTFYHSLGDPEYKPAWRDATIVEAGLILEGGSMRCLFTAGVLDYLMDEGVLPQHAIGVSAGALAGYNYVAGMRGRTLHTNAKYCGKRRYFSIPSWWLTGNLLNASFTFDKLLNELEPFDFDAYRASPLTLATVCCNIDTGEVVYAEIVDPVKDLDFVKASAYLPLVSKIVRIDGKKYLDGGMVDSVPFARSQETGLAKNVVILTQHDGFVKQPQGSLPFIKIFYRNYPRFVEHIAKRQNIYNAAYNEAAKQHKSGQTFVIRPPMPVTIKNLT